MSSVFNTILTDKRFKYITAGGLSFAAEYSSFLVLVYVLSVFPWLGQAISYCIGLVTSFLLIRQWVFHSQYKDKVHVHMYKYAVLVAFNLPVTTVGLGVLVKLGVAAFIAKIIVVIFVAVWNYTVYDKIIFRQKFSPEDIV